MQDGQNSLHQRAPTNTTIHPEKFREISFRHQTTTYYISDYAINALQSLTTLNAPQFLLTKPQIAKIKTQIACFCEN